MYIERHGVGPRAFFGLHGWSGDHTTFAPLMRDLPPDISFYSVDLPGCGKSAPPRAWTVDYVADEIAEAIERTDRNVTLVGNCSGANIGFFVAKRIPNRITRLVTIDAFSSWPWYFRVFVNPVFGRYAYFTTFQTPVGRWLTNRSLRSKRSAETSLTDGFTRVDHRATLRYLAMLRNSGSLDQFRDFAMPIDIAYGENSFDGVARSAEEFATVWPQAHVTCLAGAGHLPILEATATLRELLFLPCEMSAGLKERCA